MGWILFKEGSFEAAHWLPYHQGKCRHLHGHSYRVRVALHHTGELQSDGPEAGMVMDFGKLSSALKEVLNELDHKCLNEVIGPNPTAELVAQWIHQKLKKQLPCYLAVEVWETPTSGCVYLG